MPLMFYMDVHVPVAITMGIRRRGIDVLTSQEDGTREVADANRGADRLHYRGPWQAA